MGILQSAYRTYESYGRASGETSEGKETLIPVSHIIQKAMLEVEIGTDGSFKRAKSLDKGENTIFPATPESAGRVGNPVAHPLCDQLPYIAEYGGEKFESYKTQLTRWAESEFSHEKVRAVLAYILGGTLISDLAEQELITLDENGNPDSKYAPYLVRWRVTPSPAGISDNCWEDKTLFDSYIKLYMSLYGGEKQDVCMVSGEMDLVCKKHPKGTLANSYGAKLISTKDDCGFKYYGRFTEATQALNVGYAASQKAHNALRWIASNNGVILGGRTFICWNPGGKYVPSKLAFLGIVNEKKEEFLDYKAELSETLKGYRQAFDETDDIVVTALDAATTGRLSVAYYNELKASDFLMRIEKWYSTCTWVSAAFGEHSPSIRQIAECAFGTLRGEMIEADPKVLKEHIQQLFHCIVDSKPMPMDIARALVTKAGNMQIYKEKNREKILTTTCAAIRKYRNDRKENWGLILDKSITDRSYLFGRLLAIAEQLERNATRWEEGRETNAIRLQSIFTRRPMYGWRIIEDKLKPYENSIPEMMGYYKGLITEVIEKLPGALDPRLGSELEDTYLLGYYLQRTAFRKKEFTADITDRPGALDKSITHSSYLFGRILAVLEKIELDTYNSHGTQAGQDAEPTDDMSHRTARQPHAMQLQAAFSHYPLQWWSNIEDKLTPYFEQLKPEARGYYRKVIGEIACKLPDIFDPALNKGLEDIYLLGYYHQRNSLRRSDTSGDKRFETALDASCTERSYLYGRLLAIAERAERITFDTDETREPNAIRLRTALAQNPIYGWSNLKVKLKPYLNNKRYTFAMDIIKDLISEIEAMLPPSSDPQSKMRLNGTYLLGFYHQREAMIKSNTKNMEDIENESY